MNDKENEDAWGPDEIELDNPVRAEFEQAVSEEGLEALNKLRREKKRGVREMEW